MPDADGALAVSRGFDFGHLVDLSRRTHEETQRSAARAANPYLVTRNVKVSHRLQEVGIKGCSTSRLKLYRQFYQQHRKIKAIGPTLSDQLASTMSEDRISAIGETPSDRFASSGPKGCSPASLREVPGALSRLPGDSTDAVCRIHRREGSLSGHRRTWSGRWRCPVRRSTCACAGRA